ncbi:MAG: FAD-dependent oxidoreductase [Umezawaea sp.]
MREVEVLVVGAGTVGLTAALFLARHGVRAAVVERHPGLSRHPRAFAINGRSAELFREADVEAALVEASSRLEHNQGVLEVTTLAAADQSATASAGVTPDLRTEADRISPALLGTCPQHLIDPVLLSAARDQGATVHFGVELRSLRQDESGVVAELHDRAADERQEIRAQYLVAADGAASTVRTLLEIPTTGPGELGGHMINVLFRADLTEVVGDLRFAMCTITNPASSGILIPVDNVDRWIFHIPYSTKDGLKPTDFPPDRCRELVVAALGSSDVDVEVLGVLPWQSTARTAARFSEGRVHLVGDAAHVVPPTGGFGLNTGLADAHNLAWKLAAVLQHRAGPALLDTYETERLPIALSTMDQAVLRGHHRDLHWDLSPARAADRAAVGMEALFVTTFGYQYRSTAVLDPRATPPSTEHVEQILDGSPGTRVPHVHLRRKGEEISTIDLSAGTFTLFAGPQATSWATAAKTIATETDVPVQTCVIGPTGDTEDPDNTGPPPPAPAPTAPSSPAPTASSPGAPPQPAQPRSTPSGRSSTNC